MALQEIEYGSLATSAILNDNFDYLDDKISDVSSDIDGLQSNIDSLSTTIGNQIDGCVKLSGDQTIAGTKTFSSSPVIPNPDNGDNSTKAATTKFVNTAISNNVKFFTNYTGAISVTSGYTCPSNGWIKAYLFADYNKGGSVYVNGKTVAGCGFDRLGDYSGQYWSVLIPVKKNQVVTFTEFESHHGVKSVAFYACN